jgi:hypothetical protein
MTTTAAVATGESIVVLGGIANSSTFDSYSDSATNTYTEIVEAPDNNGHVAIGFSASPSALASGSTITGTLSANNNAKAIGAVKISATTAAITGAAVSAQANSATPSITTGASIPAGAVVVAALSGQNGVITLPVDWTAIFNGTSNGDNYAFAYKITTSEGSVTFNPTLNTNKDWTAAIAAYHN